MVDGILDVTSAALRLTEDRGGEEGHTRATR